MLWTEHIIVLSSFFFNDTATTEIYTLSLHDALPIWSCAAEDSGELNAPPRGVVGKTVEWGPRIADTRPGGPRGGAFNSDRKSTRLNSSHVRISYAVFCLKKRFNRRSHARDARG